MYQQIQKVSQKVFTLKNYNWPIFWLFLIGSLLFLSIFNLLKVDLLFRSNFLPETSTSSSVVVVMADDKSIGKIGNWPWERKKMQEVLEKVVEAKPKKIALDFVFQDKADDQDNQNLATFIKDNKIVIGTNRNQDILNSENLLKTVDIEKGDVLVPIGDNGVVSQMFFSGQTISEKLIESISQKPEIILNTKTNLPKTISIIEILEKPELANILKDKYVIIGSNSSSLGDFYQVSNKGRIPGVYIHALAASQILQNQYYQPFWYLQIIDILLLVFVALVFAMTTKLLNIAWNWLISISLINVIWLFSSIVFPLHTSFLLSLIFGLAFLLLYQLWEGYYLETKKTYQILKGRLSEAVLKLIVKNPEKAALESQKYEATLMFTDIRGFTSMSEKMDPKDIGEVLNKFLGLQADTIIEYDGVIDKFIGDAVMGWWGAPIITSDHAYLALKCAVQILKRVDEYNVNNNSNLTIGIGLNSGPVVIGDFGSKKRFNYTAIGDVVNTASRVESLTKNYSANLLFTQNVLDYLTPDQKAEFKFIKIDTVVLRGKTEKINIYSLEL